MIHRFQDLTHDALALALRHILKQLVMYNATMRMAHGLLSPSYCHSAASQRRKSAFCDQTNIVKAYFLLQDETHAHTESELTAVSV